MNKVLEPKNKYVLISCLALLLTFVYQGLTQSRGQMAVQVMSLPHFLIPLLFLFARPTNPNRKRKFFFLLMGLALAGAFVFLCRHNPLRLSIGMAVVTTYGILHITRDQKILEASGGVPPRIEKEFKGIALIFVGVTILNSVMYTTLNFRLKSYYEGGVILLLAFCLKVSLSLWRHLKGMSLWQRYSRIHVLVVLAGWNLLKMTYFKTGYWDYFVYHVVFWYLAYAWAIKNSKPSPTQWAFMTRPLPFVALTIVFYFLYVLGFYWGLAEGWLVTGPHRYLLGALSTEKSPFLFTLLYDSVFFYAWIILHVTSSWSASPVRFKVG